jgi:hypothetical protein
VWRSPQKLNQVKTIGLHFQSLSQHPPHNHSRHIQFTTRMVHRFLQAAKKGYLTRSTFSSGTRERPELFPLQRHPFVWNCWYKRLTLLADRGSPWNCHRKARWRETTDSCFANCSTQNAFCSGVASSSF